MDSHTSTHEWQRFETRMRLRRADRCLLRASAAMDAEAPDFAREVLDEARSLCPEHPELEEVSERLRSTATQPQESPRSWLPVPIVAAAIALVLASGSCVG